MLFLLGIEISEYPVNAGRLWNGKTQTYFSYNLLVGVQENRIQLWGWYCFFKYLVFYLFLLWKENYSIFRFKVNLVVVKQAEHSNSSKCQLRPSCIHTTNCTQQNSYSMYHLLDTVTGQWQCSHHWYYWQQCDWSANGSVVAMLQAVINSDYSVTVQSPNSHCV